MQFNRTRHLLLKKLAEKYIANRDKNGKADRLGLKMDEIDLLLGHRKKDRDLIISELGKSKEIHAFDINGKGFFITPSEGLSAYSEGKYLKRNNDIILKWLRNFVQIFIPIASLVVAILALSLKIEKVQQDMEKDVQRINKRIDSLNKSLDEKVKSKGRKKDTIE